MALPNVSLSRYHFKLNLIIHNQYIFRHLAVISLKKDHSPCFFINFMTIILLKQLIRELQLISDSLNEGILENS